MTTDSEFSGSVILAAMLACGCAMITKEVGWGLVVFPTALLVLGAICGAARGK